MNPFAGRAVARINSFYAPVAAMRALARLT